MSFRCRLCDTPLTQSFADLGMSPPSNSFLSAEQLDRQEPFYPLHAYTCGNCFLVQLPQFHTPEAIFSNYAYFSSFSESWLAHAKRYVESVSQRFGLNEKSQVVELGSNDGYLLRFFKERGIPVLGVEPASNVAEVAMAAGISTLNRFFGTEVASELSRQGRQADLILFNNVLAQIPELHDFVAGIKGLLKPHGIVTLEVPHLRRLVDENQFDTIYHEHFSYFSLYTLEKLFARHGLAAFDVEELSTHGGSLRVYLHHDSDTTHSPGPNLGKVRERERQDGITDPGYYRAFFESVRATKRDLLTLLIGIKNRGQTIVGYGAPAKGNTLLNYCGIGVDFLDYTVDLSPHKQGKFLPGTHIPIRSPEEIRATKPNYLLILPWNLKDEIARQMAFIRDWNGKFIVPIPHAAIL